MRRTSPLVGFRQRHHPTPPPSTPGNLAVTRNIAENSAKGTNVGSPVTATSNPNNYTLSHTLSGTDASDFTIDSSTGQIKVKSALNYENIAGTGTGKISYSVTVTVKAAAKSQGASIQSFTLEPNHPGDYVVPVTIKVTDVAEPPAKMNAPTVTSSRAPRTTRRLPSSGRPRT